MAENKTQIVITAEDRTAAAFASAKKSLGSLNESIGSIQNGFNSVIGAAVVGSLVNFVKGTIDAADGLNDLSQQVGIGIQDLATWTLAANQSGTSIESVAKGVKGLSAYIVEHGDKLRAAGITATDANGALIQLADLFSAMPDGVQKTALAVQLFGKAGMDMIPMLNMGSKGLAEAQEKAEAYGKKMAELAPQADKFNDMMSELALNSKAAGINIADHFLPGLIGMAQWLNDIAIGGEAAQRAVAWMTSERTMKALALMGHPMLAGPDKRSSSGKIGGGATPMSLADEMSLGDRNLAGLRAAGLLDKSDPSKGKAVGSVNDYAMRINEAVAGAINNSAVVKSRELAAQIEALDKLFFDAGLDMDVYTSAMQKLTGQTDKASKEAGRLAQLLDATPTAKLEETRKDMELLAGALEAGHISEEQFIEATQARLGTLGESVKEVDNFARDMGLTFASAFEDAVIGGKSLQDVIKGLGQDIERIILRKTVTEPLGNSIAGMLKGFNLFGGSGGADVALASGGVMAGQGISAYSGSVVSRPTLFPFASGIGLMGEAGAEAILPLKRGSDGKLGVSGGSGGVVVNVIEDSSRAGQVQQRQEPGGPSMIDVFVDRIRAAMASDISRGSGPVPAALAATYGLNRAAGGY